MLGRGFQLLSLLPFLKPCLWVSGCVVLAILSLMILDLAEALPVLAIGHNEVYIH